MAHQITRRASGVYEFAFRSSHGPAWHGLGQELTDNASIEQWKQEAGMDWEIFQSAVMYQTMGGQEVYADKNVLFRSDTNAPLSVVSSAYKVVQPGEVLEFFRDLTEIHGFELSAAGTLFGGKRFWATAKLGKSFQASHGDVVEGQLLLATSADGSLATQAMVTSVRTVCNNTLTLALAGDSKTAIKKTHKSVFDAKEVKLDLGVIDAGWSSFKDSITKLTEVRLEDSEVETYFKNKFYNPKVLAEDQTWGAVKTVQELMHLYRNGVGSDMSYGTAWGVVNAVTEKYTHGSGKRDQSTQFWDSEFGKGSDAKQDVFSDMLALTA